VIQKRLLIIGALMLMASFVMAQEWWEKQPLESWSLDDVTKMLDKSPWGTVYNRAVERVGHVRAAFGEVSGVEKAYDKLSFHLSFVTAQPVRMALARRRTLLDLGSLSPEEQTRYVEQQDQESIILVMTLTANPENSFPHLILTDTLDRLETADLAENTFLFADGGKKVPLRAYNHLGENGYGVAFLFPRNLPDGMPLVAAGNKEIRFESVIPLPKDKSPELRSIPIKAKWDSRKMIYKGKPNF
jgi:hypothetical protein